MAGIIIPRNRQFFTRAGQTLVDGTQLQVPLSGGKLFVYTAGTSTKASIFSDSGLSSALSNPVTLTADGRTSQQVWVAGGLYKLVVAPAADTDPPASAITTDDNVEVGRAETLAFLQAPFAAAVIEIITTLPGSPTNGDRYLVADTGTTGALVGKENQAVERIDGEWVYSGLPAEGSELIVAEDGYSRIFTDGEWELNAGLQASIPKIRDSLSASEVGMTDDAVDEGEEGTDNAALLAQALADCSTRKIPFLLSPNGGGGRYYIGAQVDVPAYMRLIGQGGRILTFGQDHHCFYRTTAGADIEIWNVEIDGDLKDGDDVPEGYTACIFRNVQRAVIRGMRIDRFNGAFGITIDGQTDVADYIDVSDNELIDTATDSGIYIIQAAKIIRCCRNFVTGNHNRTLAMGGVDDRIIVAYHDDGTHPTRRSGAGFINDNEVAFSHAHGIAVGAFTSAIVKGNIAYDCAWGLELLSSEVFDIPASAQTTMSDNLVIGGREQEPGTQTAAYKITGGPNVGGSNNRSFVTTASLAEVEGARPLYGALIVGAEKVDFNGLILSGMDATGVVSQSEDVTLTGLTVYDAGQGALLVSDSLSTGRFKLDGANLYDLFRDGTASPFRVLTFAADASDLDSIELTDISYRHGLYDRSATFLSNSSGVTAFTRRLVYDGVQEVDSGYKFAAYQSAATTNDVTGDGTAYAPICNTELYDIGGNYNNATGVFTAPVAGSYKFHFQALFTNLGSGHVQGLVALDLTGGRALRGAHANPYNASVTGSTTMQLDQVVTLAAGDTVTPRAQVTGSTKTVGVFGSTDQWTYFSGERVG